MRRRALIQTLITWLPLRGVRMWAQTATFPGTREGALKELAATVLPASLGRAGTDGITEQFIRWVREYRAGAEMQAGYGYPRLRSTAESPYPSWRRDGHSLRRCSPRLRSAIFRRLPMAAISSRTS
jgi:hypothetical protein